MKITYAQYEKYLKADNMIRTTAVCQAPDEAEVVVERDIILDNPTLTLEVKGWGKGPPQPANPHEPRPLQTTRKVLPCWEGQRIGPSLGPASARCIKEISLRLTSSLPDW